MSRGAVEGQEHRLRRWLDDGHRDVIPGEGTDRRGGLPERMRGQFDGAVLAKVTAEQVCASETGQLAQLGSSVPAK
jgi:hypothetical protein